MTDLGRLIEPPAPTAFIDVRLDQRAAGTAGTLAYLALVRALRVPEAAFVMDAVRRKLQRG